MNLMLCRDSEILRGEEAFSVYGHCMYQPNYAKYLREVAEPAENGTLRTFVCLDGGRIAGILVLSPTDSGAEIKGIAVSSGYRSRGVGRNMIFWAMEEEYLQYMFAETDDDAVDFYRKCGFAIQKRIETFPDREAVRYLCRLGNS